MRAIASRFKPGAPTEICGLVLRSGRVIEVPNAHPEPEKGFAISANEMHRYRRSVAGTWHTHPHQPAALSQDDYVGFSQWPGLTHFIVGTDGVRAYRAGENGVIEEVDLASD